MRKLNANSHQALYFFVLPLHLAKKDGHYIALLYSQIETRNLIG